MKKIYRAASAAITALCLAAAGVLPAAAGTLSPEELFQKYDHSAFLRDENGKQHTALDCKDKESAGDFFVVPTCGFDQSYPDYISALPKKNVTLLTNIHCDKIESTTIYYRAPDEEHEEGDRESWYDSDWQDVTIWNDVQREVRYELAFYNNIYSTEYEPGSISRQEDEYSYDEVMEDDIFAAVFNDYRYYDVYRREFRYTGCQHEGGFYFVEKNGGACVVGINDGYFEDKFNNIPICIFGGVSNEELEQKHYSVTIPDTLGGLPVTEIADGAFARYADDVPAWLNSIFIPDSVEVIGWHAFDHAIRENSQDAHINLPASLKAVYPFAFRLVGQYLETTQYPESVEYIGRNAVTAPEGTEMPEMKLPESAVFVEEDSRLQVRFSNIVDWFSYTIDEREENSFDSHEIYWTDYFDDGALRLTDAAKYYLMQKKDINGDGETDVKDAVLLSRIVGGDTTVAAEDVNSAAGDVNGNGKTDAEDLTLLLRQLAKLA